jgi:MFS family permease
MADDLPRTRRHFVALTALRWFPTGVVLPVMVLLMRERGLSVAQVGIVLAIYSVVTATLELPTGGLADVLGRRPVLVLSASMTIAGTVLLGVGQTLPVLGVAAGVLGVARALDSGPLQAWYVDTVQAIDARADLRQGFSQAGAAEAAGLGIGALVGGGLVAISPLPQESGAVIALSTPFLLAAALSACSLVAVVAWVQEPPRETAARLGDAIADVPSTIVRGAALTVGRGPLRRIVTYSAALGVALAGVELLAPANFARLLGGASQAAGPYAVLVTLGFAGTAVGSALAPAVARMLRSPSRGILASALISAVSVLAISAPTLGVAATAFLTFYLLLGIGGPLLDELTHAAVESSERATVLSVRSMVFQLGGMTASLSLGVLAGATTFTIAFATLTVILALGSMTLVRMPQAKPARTDTVSQMAH